MLDSTTRNLIQSYLDAQSPDQLFTFVETLIDQRNRAELQTQSYLHTIKVLKTRTDEVLKPLLEKPLREPTPTKPTPQTKPKKETTKATLDLEISL